MLVVMKWIHQANHSSLPHGMVCIRSQSMRGVGSSVQPSNPLLSAATCKFLLGAGKSLHLRRETTSKNWDQDLLYKVTRISDSTRSLNPEKDRLSLFRMFQFVEASGNTGAGGMYF
ncbi:uncharacterized protein LOC144282280 [Canis aureus]